MKYLMQITELEECNQNDLVFCAHIVKYKSYKRNNCIPRKSDSVTYWYNILYGSVMVGSAMFLPHSSFWIKEENEKMKQYDCIVLEDTGVLAFTYDECPHFYYPCKCVRKIFNDTLAKMKLIQKPINKSQTGSDTSSGYSGSEKISNGDNESISFKVGYINDPSNSQLLHRRSESVTHNADALILDSDSEDDDLSDFTFNEISCQDHIKDILQKPSSDRSIQENEVIMNVMQNIPLFSLWTQSLRCAACKLARLQLVEKNQTVLIRKDDKLSDWIYCLQGTLEVRRTLENHNLDSHKHLGDVLETLRYSDSFGADLRLSEEQTSNVFLVTTSSDCWLMLINWKDFMISKSQEPTTLSQIIENSKTVVVLERRCIGDGINKGQVIVKATVKKLIDYLFENHSAIDENFIEDFFLTYNIYMDSTVLVRNVIIDQIRRFPEKRKKCTEIVVKWIKNHFREIENQCEIMKFIDFIVMLLFRENEEDSAGKIYHACSKYSTQRSVTIISNDKDSGSQPIITGNGSRVNMKDKISTTIDHYPVEFARCSLFRNGHKLNNLFVSHNRNCGDLRPGDRILQINNTSEENLTEKTANAIILKSQLTILSVKYDPEGFYSPFLVNYIKRKTKNCSDRSLETRSAVIEFPDNCNDPGYSTLPLKPKLGGGGPHSHGLMKKMLPSHVNQSATSSALKKMMKRCKANSSFTDEKKLKSKSKSRSAHNSPDRYQASNPDLAFNDTFSENNVNSELMSTSFTVASNNNLKVETPTVRMRKVRSRCDSQPDLRKFNSYNGGDLSFSSYESVIKVHYKDPTDAGTSGKANVKFVYLVINKETEALEVIVKCLVELNLSCASNSEFCLCEVSVEPGQIVKQKTIKENMNNLIACLKLNTRFYLKRRDFSSKLIDNTDIEEISSEMNVSFFDLPVCELATQIFIESYNTFKIINLSEIIDFVTGKTRKESVNGKLKPDINSRSFSIDNYSENRDLKLTDTVNNFQEYLKLGEKYMYFVVNVVCNEIHSTSRRSKILKRLIRLARLSKELGNIEIFFSLMNGLDRVEISRLRNTWERVPNKELKMYRQMQQLLDVSGNMRLLRSLHKSCKPPVIPMAALVTKDLTTIHEVHPTKVDPDGPDITQKSDNEYLINFDKLRIMSNRARSFKNLLCGAGLNMSSESELVLPDDESAQIVFVREMLSKIDHKTNSKNLSTSQTHLNRRRSTFINPKKMHENEINRLRVKHFISKIEQMERDDAILLSMSYKCEPRSEFSGLTPNVSRSTIAGILTSPTGNFEREDILSIRNSTGGSISSKESSQTNYSSGSEQFSELTTQNNYRLNSKYNRTNTSTPLSGQLQYLEPSGSQRRHVLPPPYSSIGSIPPIPPRRRSSVVSGDKETQDKSRSYSNPLSNEEVATHL